MKNMIGRELLQVAESLRDYIDAIPEGVKLPAMPGMDRDWVDGVIAMAKVDLDPEAYKPDDEEIADQIEAWDGRRPLPPTDGMGG